MRATGSVAAWGRKLARRSRGLRRRNFRSSLGQGVEAMMGGPKVPVQVPVNFLIAGLQPL
jgi:hypothetical protein